MVGRPGDVNPRYRAARGGKQRNRSIQFVAGFLLSAGLSAAWILAQGYEWLASAGEAPRASDLLVVLGGGSWERFATAVQLYHDGFAPRILVTGGPGEPGAALGKLEAAGVPPGALLKGPKPARSTWEDAAAIREVVLRQRVGSLLVVTSPYHCRRARVILRRALSGLPVRVTVTPSIALYMDPDCWWASRQGWITVAPEFPKIVWAWVATLTVMTGSP